MSDTVTPGTDLTWTSDELMTVAASRLLTAGMTCFVGIGKPSTAANLARLLHAPDLVLIYESGPIGAKPTRLPLSIGDGELASTADLVVSIPEMFNYWLGGGKIQVGFLGAAQIDRWATINTTVIGDYAHPKVRLPGAGGAPEIARNCAEVFVIVRQGARTFVEEVDFATSPANAPTTVVTDLGVLRSKGPGDELTLTAIHPGVEIDQVKAATAWDLAVAGDLATTAAPTAAELTALRDLEAASAVD
ncbi:MAG: CoA-transferase [Actinomycetota bacterium]|nr:CoA-transferase [Actinomycetota bacterium]